MSEKNEAWPSIVGVVRIRCGGVEFNNKGQIQLAIHDFHQKVDSLVTQYSDGTTRVRCPYFGRDDRGSPLCRVPQHHGYYASQIEDDSLPNCTYANDEIDDFSRDLREDEISDDDFEEEEEAVREEEDEDIESEE